MSREDYRKLKKRFEVITAKNDLRYEIMPYFISSHPGCTDGDMKDLVAEVKSLGIKPEQVQDFTPTPMTLSTLMYYTGFDPFTGKKVYVAKSSEDKKRQKEFFFWYRKPEGGKSKELRAQGTGHGAKSTERRAQGKKKKGREGDLRKGMKGRGGDWEKRIGKSGK